MRIHETEHWILKQRGDSKLPGYLILASRADDATSLSDLEHEALCELGLLQAAATSALESKLGASLVYVCRFGHDTGYSPHFHLVPLYPWIEEAYAADTDWPDEDPDGPVYFKYITEVFALMNRAPEIDGPSIEDAVATLRGEFHPKTPTPGIGTTPNTPTKNI